jgi:hypothetical protein
MGSPELVQVDVQPFVFVPQLNIFGPHKTFADSDLSLVENWTWPNGVRLDTVERL